MADMHGFDPTGEDYAQTPSDCMVNMDNDAVPHMVLVAAKANNVHYKHPLKVLFEWEQLKPRHAAWLPGPETAWRTPIAY